MSDEELALVTIGEVNMYSGPQAKRGLKSIKPVGYDVEGLPSGYTATLHQASLDPEGWYFAAAPPGMKYQSSANFSSKDEALEGLKEWLKTTNGY